MERPHSGGTAYVITVSPVPGKYALQRPCIATGYTHVQAKCGLFINTKYIFKDISISINPKRCK